MTRRGIWIKALLGLACGLAWWAWQGQAELADAIGTKPPLAAARSAQTMVGNGRAGVPGAALAPDAGKPQTPPELISADELRKLDTALRDHPQRDKELKRIVAYLQFQRQLAQWQTLQDAPDRAGRLQLATRLLDGVPERLANREMNASEAMAIQAELVSALLPEGPQQQARLQAERQRLDTAPTEHERAAQQREDAMHADYARREAEILARWRLIPSEQRDPKQLERQLDAARVAAWAN